MLKPGQLATLLPIILISGCMSYSEVELVSVRNAELTRFDARGLSATITAEVYNPNNFRINVMDPDMDLYINDVAMGKATLDSTIVLTPNCSCTYTVPLHATFTNGQAGLLPLLLTSALNGTIKLGVKGTVLGKARSLRKRFPFEVEQQIDLGR
ncbi:MAG: LEA type 2 family protein [Flavobacteriales bacterium]|nr:LEA type 2 family protein [Flavobacteriales bacterium]MCB0757203.1 LEA type 2 family protein [Flavobacteriales bacterium]